MDKRTLTALQESIEKWRQIERGEMGDEGVNNCSLCDEFIWRGCIGCPVSEKSGMAQCRGTPYEEWAYACKDFGNWCDIVTTAETPELVKLARAERKFLESLLP